MTQSQPPADISHSKPELSILHDVAKALTSSLNLDSILQTIMEKVAAYFRPDTWSLLMTDDEHHELYFAIAVGDASASLKSVRLRIGEGIAGWVAQHGKPLLVPDVTKDERFAIPHRRDDDAGRRAPSSASRLLQKPHPRRHPAHQRRTNSFGNDQLHAAAGHGRLRRHRHRQRPRRRKNPGTHHHRRLHRPLQRAPPL